MSSLAPLVPEPRNLIDGKLVGSGSGNTFDNISPASGQVIGVTSDGTRADMEAAIAAARRAFDETSWSTAPAFRAECLRQLHAGLVAAAEDLRAIVVAEAGAPVMTTPWMQIDGPIEMVAYWAELTDRYEYERSMDDIEFMGRPHGRLLRREATGVVGAITPWNVPVYLNIAKLGPALASGCTVVLKPAPDTPWSATTIARIIAEQTDIPAGVVNVVASADHQLGEMLATDPRVDLVTFTGSTETGRRVMECASRTLKRVFLELGGKSAHIVLDDLDIRKVAGSFAATCAHAGQGCAILTRVLLPRSLYDEGVELAVAAFDAVNYGDPTDPVNFQGPLISRRQQERVLAYIGKGRAEGARLVRGGGVPAHLPDGFYVEPTVFADVDPAHTISREEIFGPVLSITPYDTDDDAVRIANDSVYGLSGAVSGADEERALAVARRIRAGTLAVNGAQWFDVDTPFGGYKQSGLGRENGVAGFEEYLETKVISKPARS